MKLPYYAAIFTSKRKAQEGDGYPQMAAKMDALAQVQPGFLGTDAEGLRSGITVSYWKDEGSIKAWKSNLEHLLAQKRGKDDWYLHYEVRVAKVERAYAGGGDTRPKFKL
ncbi:antibiotic biosynthesis monooxygenase [Mycena galopus ATCC 62051]|nr:antibiotic biosynthesis monooxygenase [Mycena galopus ATCC 62051]